MIIFLPVILLLPCTMAIAQIQFIDNGQRLGTGSSNDVALGDLDGDGDLDAFVINGQWNVEEPNEVWFNNGDGTFTASDQIFGNSKCGEVGLADLDNDGDLDAFIGYYNYMGGEPDQVWFNDGTGHFTDSGQRLDHRNGGVALADLDNDGDIDAFVCNHVFDDGTNGQLKIWLNNGAGTFTDSGQALGNGNHTGVDLGDLDGDGDIDALVTFNYGAAGNKIWLNDGEGNFTAGQTVSMDFSADAGLGDLDGDGDPDIFITHRGGNKVYLNDGTGQFTSSGQLLGSSDSETVGLGDFDGDGDLDAFVLNAVYQEPRLNEIWINNGEGIFTDSGLRPGLDESYDIELGDLDSDGDLDAFVAITGPNKVWINTPYVCHYPDTLEPSNTPLLFAPGTISVNGKNTHACVFSPKGDELFFSRYPDGISYRMNYDGENWSDPAIAFFNGKETSISPYLDKIFYYNENGDIYYNYKTTDGWSDAFSVGNEINTAAETEYYPSITYDGTLFFSRNGNWDQGRIMYSSYTTNGYITPVDIGLPVNTGGALHAFIAPDKSYMLFNSPRSGSNTDLDIWISYRKQNGMWTYPKNPGVTINSGADAILCPTVTPDGKYMFFTRLNFDSNTGNLFWVSTAFIDSLRTTNFTPYLLSPIPDQSEIRGTEFSYPIPDNTFVDDDEFDTLTYSIALAGGGELPSWLDFTPENHTFSGIPPENDTLEIQVTVIDTAGVSVSDSYNLMVSDPSAIVSEEKNEICIYPNPASDILYITNLNSPVNTFQIYDLQGKLLRTLNNVVGSIDISILKESIYIIKLIESGSVSIQKFFKE
jgi:hypothetical protein